MPLRPIPTTPKDVEDKRYGMYRGKKLCDCCGDNIATTRYDGDRVCSTCAYDLKKKFG